MLIYLLFVIADISTSCKNVAKCYNDHDLKDGLCMMMDHLAFPFMETHVVVVILLVQPILSG